MKASVKVLAASIITISASAALADATGFYVGGGVGQSKFGSWASKSDMIGLLDVMAAGAQVYDFDGDVSTKSDDKDTGFKVFGGYQFGRNFAVEASYIDLGEASASAGATGLFYSGYGNFNGSMRVKATGETEALTLDALLTLPVADMAQIFFKAGVYYAETDLKISAAATVEEASARDSDTLSDDSTGVHFGLGVNFNLTQNLALRAEWERLADVELEDSEADVDLLSASLIYRF